MKEAIEMNFIKVILTVLTKIKWGMLFFAFVSFNLKAESPSETQFNTYFKSGEYEEALVFLTKVNSTDFEAGQKSYLEGLTYSMLQDFDKSIKSFEKAISEHNQKPDLQYVYGQALYAANDLRAARKAFKLSASNNYKISVSNYYVAHISQILEEYLEAKKMFFEIIKSPETDTALSQISHFQLAETLLALAKNSNKENTTMFVSRSIIPLFKKAISLDKNAQIASDINQRLLEVQTEYGLDPDLLANGRRIPSKRYTGYLSQKINFDNNVTLTDASNNAQQTTKSSLLFESEFYAKYDFVVKKKLIVSPEIRYNFIHYSNSQDPDVYENNSYFINANLKNKYEHIINNQPASFLFDFDFGKTFKDWQQTHKREAYTESMSVGIGESFNYFDAGDTTFRLKIKNYTGVNESISNHTFSFSGDQVIFLTNQNLLIAFVEASLINNFNNPNTSFNTLMGRFDYIMPEIKPLYTIDLALATTLTDTLAQKDIRGTEITINPSIDLTKAITKEIKMSFNYAFTKNISKSNDYNYTKSIFTLGLNYSF